MSKTGKYWRVLLKLSGEAFAGEDRRGIDEATVVRISRELQEASQTGLQLGVVVGGGNIWRGDEGIAQGMDPVQAHHMGMLATIINALALQDALERLRVETRCMTAIEMREVAEPWIHRRAIRHLEKGRIVIMAAGTGQPGVTTDTAAVLRAVQIGADAIFKATNVEGVYDKDPRREPDAKFLPQVTYKDVLHRDLRVMDATAISLAMDNNLPIIVFNIRAPRNIIKALLGEGIGTHVAA